MSAEVRAVIGSGVRRHRVVGASAAVFVVLAVFGALFLGDYQLTLPQMLDTLGGNAPEQRAEFFIMQRRLPRAIVAVLVGAALGLAGDTFQRMTANPLASPDIIGISGGASAGGAFVMLILGGSLAGVAAGAVTGALLAAAIIFLVAVRTRGFSSRVVLAGVGIAALSGAGVSYLLTQVFVARAVTAQTWLVGTMQGRGWDDALPVVVALLIAIPVLAATSRSARMLDLGDDLARGTGVHPSRTRALRLVVATLLTAGAVAVTGPISFVALAAPHIARSLVRSPSAPVAALTGAVVLLVSDQIAQHAFSLPIPVGVVTVVFGGGFLLWLILIDRRRRG